MGYINPLLKLPAAQQILELPDSPEKRLLEQLLRELRADADAIAEKSWRARKGMIAGYWRAVATYARHAAHVFRRAAGTSRSRAMKDGRIPVPPEMLRLVEFRLAPRPTRWIVGAGDVNAGRRGTLIGTLGFRRHHGEPCIVLRMADDGKAESFSPMQVFPDLDGYSDEKPRSSPPTRIEEEVTQP